MEIGFNVGNLITIVSAAIMFAFGYGTLAQKVKDITEHKKTCEKRFDCIEKDHQDNNKQLTDTVRQIEKTLDQLVGKIDMFFEHFFKETRREK